MCAAGDHALHHILKNSLIMNHRCAFTQRLRILTEFVKYLLGLRLASHKWRTDPVCLLKVVPLMPILKRPGEFTVSWSFYILLSNSVGELSTLVIRQWMVYRHVFSKVNNIYPTCCHYVIFFCHRSSGLCQTEWTNMKSLKAKFRKSDVSNSSLFSVCELMILWPLL